MSHQESVIWEYCVYNGDQIIHCHPLGRGYSFEELVVPEGADKNALALGQLGFGRWELVSAVWEPNRERIQYYFKRPMTEPNESVDELLERLYPENPNIRNGKKADYPE